MNENVIHNGIAHKQLSFSLANRRGGSNLTFQYTHTFLIISEFRASYFSNRNNSNIKMKQYFPQILSWSTQDDILSKQLTEVQDGICIFNDVELKMPITSMRNTFCRIYENNNLAKRLNEVYPIRGIFKDGSLNLDHVDQKVLLDLSPARLRSIVENDKELIGDLGEDFWNIVLFYNAVQKNIISRLIPLAEQGISGQTMDIHNQFNYNYRMVDYYPVRKETRRCGEHRDYGSFTLIFQDGTVGGLEVFSNGLWSPIPPDAGIIFLWGWSAEILSNRRIRAPLHRVVSVTGDGNLAPRRNAAIFFVAPGKSDFIFQTAFTQQ